MSLDHTMILGQFRAGIGSTNLMKVTQGAKLTVPFRQQTQHSHSLGVNFKKQMFVYNGNIYFPFGSIKSNARGWAKYNPELGEFETFNGNNIGGNYISIGDRVAWGYISQQGYGSAPEDKIARSATDGTFYANDYVIVGTEAIILCHQSTKRLFSWTYPFSGNPSPGSAHSVTIYRICEIGGEVFGVYVNSGAGSLDVYKMVGGVLTLLGTPTTHSTLTNYDGVNPSFFSMFKFNNKLFFITHANVAAVQKMRLFEIDTTLGTTVERNSYLPTEWGNLSNPSTSTTGVIFEVRDDIGANEQVFLVRCEQAGGGWECYEFAESLFPVVITGQGDQLYPLGGAIFDPTVKAPQIKTAADSVPSSAVEMEVEVFDLDGQGTVNIDPRYRLNSSEPPPYNVCTGKAPYAGKTGLASVPSGITTLADLSDDFSAGSINNDLWQRYAQSILAWLVARDMGASESSSADGHRVQQIGGAMRFSQVGEVTQAYNGMGVKSRWSINGEFQIDFTIKDPDNIRDPASVFASQSQGIVALVRLSPNEGFGFVIWRSTVGPQTYVRGIYMPKDADFQYSTDFIVIDGEEIRIERNGANVWTVTRDPGGIGSGTQDITPAGGAAYSEPVYIVMAGSPSQQNYSWVEIGTPDGDEPGFSEVAVGGAGSLGLYDGGVIHRFDWDHVIDEGAGISGTAELFVDSET